MGKNFIKMRLFLTCSDITVEEVSKTVTKVHIMPLSKIDGLMKCFGSIEIIH